MSQIAPVPGELSHPFPAKPLAQYVILLTGASRGIGKALALALARAGASLLLMARDAAVLTDLAAECHSLGAAAEPLPVDLRHEAAILQRMEQICNIPGRLDVLINNAGLGIYGPVADYATADWDAVMAVNARAPFILCRAALPLLRQSPHATIINLSSVMGIKGYVNQAAYAASKHALMGFSKVLAQEEQPHGVRVHTLCPGAVATEMVTQARPDLDPTKLIRPEEIAEIVLFLLTHRNNAVLDDLHLRRASGDPWF
jgi:3-oxoacyl-[acyl-carrier protein] reductase